MKLTDKSKEALYKCEIPEYMHGGIIRYYENYIKPGDFLTAVINNDLRDACAHADDLNKHCLYNYFLWFYNEAPSGSWGYEGATHDWLMKGADNA